MISYPAFYNELAKIAEEEAKTVTGPRLKRGLMAAAATGAGAGLGHATGKLIRRAGHKTGVDLARKVPPSMLRKYGPAAVGGLGALVAALYATKARKEKQFIDEGQRPK